jgi:type IV pilus assembly protein PilY1
MNTLFNTKYRLTGLYLAVTAALSISGTALAADLDLSDTPLTVLTRVQPNIFFVLDDSGSMDWEVLKSTGAIAAHGTWNNSGNLDFSPNDDTERRELCVGYNVLAYDPNTVYTPWAGEDSAGNPFVDQTRNAARTDPYYTGTTNLSNHYYYVWNDSNNDGVYQSGECPISSSDQVVVNGLSAAEQTNYANWYSYYRKREYVAKRSLSQIMSESTDRMGLYGINQRYTGTPIKDVDDITLPVDTTAQANKETLLDNLLSGYSSGSTPLRRGLNYAGNYFEDNLGSPWQTPILSEAQGGSCQQNFTVLMSDGFWNGSSPEVGDTDSDNNTAYDGGSHADGGTASNTLADVAMRYYERDLSPLPDLVPTVPGVDDNPMQHMVTYTVAFGVNGTIANNPPDRTTPFNWPTPVADTTTTTDDMRHAAWNGRGLFLSAGNPQQLIISLRAAISDIGDRTGSAAAVAANSGYIDTGTNIFQGRYDSGDWSGQLLSIALDTDPTSDTYGEATTVNWDAAQQMPTASNREIITSDGSTGVPFQWSSISATQQSLLGSEAILNYLRGVRTGEGSTYRTRDVLLGDIVHSSPAFVDAPLRRYPDTWGGSDAETSRHYSSFKSTYSSRTPMIYVGANDGMLHGFNASTGVEEIAYVPSMVYRNLSELTAQSYSHRYFVDSSPVEGDALFNNAWHTVLTGALNGGGQGIYALDITDTNDFSEAHADDLLLWEFTDADDADLGYTYSKPSIVRMQNGQWAVIFGNGYNNTEADGNASTTGHAVLYIAFIGEGTDGTWASGDYIKIDTLSGSTTSPNGLATVSPVDIDGDFKVDYIYGGDLYGNVWKFDVDNSSASQWGVAFGTTSAPLPLFRSCTNGACTAGTQQPITVSPVVGLGPRTERPRGVMVYFGTGKYIEKNDNDVTSPQMQSLYGIWDNGSNSNFTRSSLQQQSIVWENTYSFTDPDGATVTWPLRVTSNNDVNWSTHRGWYMDLVPPSGTLEGERVIADPALRHGRIIFVTYIPSVDPCSSGADSWIMELDPLTGSRLEFSPFDLNNNGGFETGDYVTIDIDGDGTPDAPVPTSGRKIQGGATEPAFLVSRDGSEVKIVSRSDGSTESIGNNPGPRAAGRQSWRQLK